MGAAVARGTDEAARLPDRFILDGQRTLGFVFIDDDTFSATDADGVPLGSFPKLDLARGAVVKNARGGQHG